METAADEGTSEDCSNNNVDPGVDAASSSRHFSKKSRIFSLRAANSFGRDEIGPKLLDDGRPLKLNSE